MSTTIMSGGNIEPRGLEEEMRSSYLDYAMSVIVGRALPDVRDGLKPVHRRVLYSMNENGLQPNRPYVKAARIVGDVMGKYHPHGDSAIYDTLVRMAQDFSLRYPLVDGQGNFGSIDDDPAAAMRYTEARLAPIAREMLRDLDSDTVDFGPNYDGSGAGAARPAGALPEPAGQRRSSGIAVGMATNIPPHNLARRSRRRSPSSTTRTSTSPGLMQHMKGPDFPTGGVILGLCGIRDAYETGRGRVRVRARAHIEQIRGNREAIVVTELPFMVKKGGDSGVINKIVELLQREEAHRDLRRPGPLGPQRHADRDRAQARREPEGRAQQALQAHADAVHVRREHGRAGRQRAEAAAAARGHPATTSGTSARSSSAAPSTSCARSSARVHRLEGLLIALDHLDEVIALIRASSDRDTARTGLMERFELTEIQAQAVLDLRLQQLTALEADALRKEHADKIERIRELRELLGDEDMVLDADQDRAPGDLRPLRRRAAHARSRPSEDDIDIEDLIADQQMVISITNSGYIKSLPLATYRAQRRGGVGIIGMDMKDEDFIEHLFVSSTHDYLLFFTNRGKVYRSKVYDLPEMSRTSQGALPRQRAAAARGRAGAVRARHARLHRGAVPGLRDPQRHGQEDGLPGLQHADQGRRHHRHQHPRRRRARRRPAGATRTTRS